MGRDDQGVRKSAQRYQWVPRALVFITRPGQVLLLKGAPDKKIWPGLYNGVGGHVERDEDVLAAALREVEEETGLRPARLQLCGVVNIDTGQDAGIGLFVFKGEAAGQEPRVSSEGELEWVSIGDIPALHLVEDLPALLPRVLAMRPDSPPFFAHYGYDEDDRLAIRFRD